MSKNASINGEIRPFSVGLYVIQCRVLFIVLSTLHFNLTFLRWNIDAVMTFFNGDKDTILTFCNRAGALFPKIKNSSVLGNGIAEAKRERLSGRSRYEIYEISEALWSRAAPLPIVCVLSVLSEIMLIQQFFLHLGKFRGQLNTVKCHKGDFFQHGGVVNRVVRT